MKTESVTGCETFNIRNGMSQHTILRRPIELEVVISKYILIYIRANIAYPTKIIILLDSMIDRSQ